MPSGDSSYNLFINMFYTQLFTVLKRIADNRRDGQLPIHVRLWADEYYAGPKPLNCETLLGRNTKQKYVHRTNPARYSTDKNAIPK